MTEPHANSPRPASPPPPVVPRRAHDFKRALLLNFCLPGAGLIYVGQRVSGFLIGGAFSVCLLAAVGIFLLGYARYMSLAVSDNPLEGNRLEDIPALFHVPWLLGLLGFGLILLFLSIAVLRRPRRSRPR